jgi:hypothetical protein
LEAAFGRRDGIVVQPVGELWAAFSPVSSETILLNNECAAVLEVLAEGPASTQQVAEHLALDTGDEASELRDLVAACWNTLIDNGLVQKLPNAPIIGA